METLVDAAAGSFVYATTVIRFVDHRGLLGYRQRLSDIIDTILNRRKNDPHAGTNSDDPFAELDAFYIMILQRIPADILPSVHLLLVVTATWGGVSAMLAANILGLSKDEFETIYNHASAVVLLVDPGVVFGLDSIVDSGRAFLQANLDKDTHQQLYQPVAYWLGGQVTFCHKSFSDFLRDPARSGHFCVKTTEMLGMLKKKHLDIDPTYHWTGSGKALHQCVVPLTAYTSHHDVH